MFKFVAKRFLNSLILSFVVASLGLFCLALLPGDPLEARFGEKAYSLEIKRESPLSRYINFIGKFIKEGPGSSLITGRKIVDEILDALPYSILLAIFSVSISLIFSFPLGVLSALKERSIFESLVLFLSVIFNSFPVISLGPLLIIIFSLWLKIFPVSGAEGFKHLFLPSLTLSLPFSAYLTRIIRKTLTEELKQGYIFSLRARGIRESFILLNHAIRNSLFPIITTLNLRLGSIITGAILTETLFSWPGMGRLLVRSVNGRDYGLTFGIIIVISFTYIFLTLVTDISYALLDPRVASEYEK